jgi:predicted exporter
MTPVLALSGWHTFGVITGLIAAALAIGWAHGALQDRANRREAERDLAEERRWLDAQRRKSERRHPSNVRDGDR